MDFRIIGLLSEATTIAAGHGIRELDRLRRLYGPVHWRKRKGEASIQLSNGAIRRAEVHWYEAAHTGKKEFKVKRYLDSPT